MTFNHMITHKGVTDTIGGWSKQVGISHTVIYDRLQRGWSVSKALTTPVRPWTPRRPVVVTPTASVVFPLDELKRQNLARQRQFNSILRQFNRDLHAIMGRGVGLDLSESRPDRSTPPAQDSI